MDIAGGQNEAFVRAAARRAREVVREVSQGLEGAPGVTPDQAVERFTSREQYGTGRVEETEHLRVGRDHVTHEKTTDHGQVVKQSVERYHEGQTEAGDRALLLAMSKRHVPAVVSRLCGALGAIGMAFQPQDSIVYRRQADAWDGVNLSSHRTSEKVRVYPDGAVYERSDDQDHVRVFLPGFQAAE